MKKLDTKVAAAQQEEVEHQEETKDTTTFHLVVLGNDGEEIEVPVGTSVAEVLKAKGLTGLEVRLNKEAVSKETVINEGDVLVVVPDAVVGGANGL